MDLLPKHFELAHLEQVSQVEDGLDLGILLYFLREQTLAEDKVSMREVGQRFQKDLEFKNLRNLEQISETNLDNYGHVGVSGIELVKFQEG